MEASLKLKKQRFHFLYKNGTKDLGEIKSNF